jgi:hypothetical protein
LRPRWSKPVALAALLLCLVLNGCGGEKPAVSTLAPTLTARPIPASVEHIYGTPLPSATVPPTTTPPPGATATQPSPTKVAKDPTLVWLAGDLSLAPIQSVANWISAQPEQFARTDEAARAVIRIGTRDTGDRPIATWVYALVAPFPTLVDGVAWSDVKTAWAGTPTGPFSGRPLLMAEETLPALERLLGNPAPGAVMAVPGDKLLERAWGEQPAWAILPFDQLEPRWKVLRIDGVSPLDRNLDLATYPLVLRLYATGPQELLGPMLTATQLPATNRDENRMTVVVMTGVTALTRATAWRMEQKGVTYPAQDIGDWLRNADITHVSNEVSFDPECGPPNPVQEGLLFCSDPRYIQLLEDIGVDVVEMTGNHIADAGVEHIEPTLDMYVERGWQYFGGGRNLEEARQPAIFEHNGNHIAFLGCNPVGPAYVWATAERAGATPCDYDLLYAQVGELAAQGILPIVTLQYWEEDRYDPTPQQVSDFEALIDAGAVLVSGSHAHHAQGFGFRNGYFIHYGVGNLFFDQMEILGNRQEFIDRHIFYAGRHISTELLTALLEDWSRPRPMTEEERLQLLQTVFEVSRW